MYVDFSNYPLSNIYYGGSERKLGILINNERYMLKFQKETPFGKRFNHISEYLGSHIFELLGFNTHKTFLGNYNECEVVACKDFVTEGVQFVPFNDVGESSIEVDKETYQYSYEDIVKLLEKNKKLTNVEETVSIFFEMYIVDALLGNFDRHGANWGFLKKENKYVLAPIFDNGSSLFPQMINEDEMKMIIDSNEEIDKRVYKFPTSQIKLHNKKSSYFDVISSLEFEKCNEALIKVYEKIDMDKINSLIDGINLSNIHKEFYKVMLKSRYEKIIKFSYDKLMERKI
ncbi:MAG: HipA domain-containing protein [Anaeroplasma sp.]|nr:HipA domain-containing protein [Anaeroplasma sp.]